MNPGFILRSKLDTITRLSLHLISSDYCALYELLKNKPDLNSLFAPVGTISPPMLSLAIYRIIKGGVFELIE